MTYWNRGDGRLATATIVVVLAGMTTAVFGAACSGSCNPPPIPRPSGDDDAADIGPDVADTFADDTGADDTGANDTGGDTADVPPDAPPATEGWAKVYKSDGTIYEQANAMVATPDGGVTICGEHATMDRRYEAWLIELDPEGGVEWDRTYGGDQDDRCKGLIATDDGGYLAVGQEYSVTNGPDPKPDAWVLKLDSTGNLEWERHLGGDKNDTFNSVVANDDGYLAVGYTGSFGEGGSCGQLACWDAWAVQLGPSGSIQWASTYGVGGDHDTVEAIAEFSGGSYAIGGWTNGFGEGDRAAFVAEIDASGTLQWQKSYATAGEERINSLALLGNDDIVVGGVTANEDNEGDVWLARLSPGGDLQWQIAVGGSKGERLLDLIVTSDGAIAFTGDAQSFTEGRAAGLGRVSADGNLAWYRHFGLNLDIEQNWGYALTEQKSQLVVAGVTNWIQASNGDLFVGGFDAKTGVLGCGLDADSMANVDTTSLQASSGTMVESQPSVASGNVSPTVAAQSKTVETHCP